MALNRTVFSFFLKTAKLTSRTRISGGSAFQRVGQDTANALGPIVFVQHAATTSSPAAADRRCDRAAMLEIV